ncbi:hypothetical protein, variant 1 [Aphanomyces invadans]|uniref:Uncharacterized protein n=1 Tax=Aphanomyces invadans TaxID=157072 RepID=A0A024UEK7_9STRA|nr:hypothetical protein, variant 1 [Aphanomyces invadans]ETW04312.1 hypothetical protein, variant 1 [Aphanomyces invadans]|eukprot:XP_008867268.1 hypothetical protein, variant 1 [Aphanomyces invadans]
MNWLEKGCVRAAPAFKRRTPKQELISNMLRQGHLSHRSASKLFGAPKLANLEPLGATEMSGKEKLEAFALQESHYRFRPSILLPLASCASTTFGHVLGTVSPQLSRSYAAGVKLAIGDYYNDQIREIYAEMPDYPEAVPLKELFKSLRDASLADVERLFPSIEAAKEDSVVQFAKTITQALLRPAASV